MEQVARGALDRFRSTEVSGDEHEEGSGDGGGGSERWNYASVHLTECDESDRNSRQRPSRASSRSREYITGSKRARVIQPRSRSLGIGNGGLFRSKMLLTLLF